MTEIWAEWKNGEKECVDTAESESEALYLIGEYRMAYGDAAVRLWPKESEQKGNDGTSD